MKQISKVDLSEAEMSLAVANSPLFLLRKLRTDPAIKRISDAVTSAQLVAYLRSILKRKPNTLRASVLPYACVVALAMRNSDTELQVAAKLDAPFAAWFKYIANVLIETGRSTSRLTLRPTAPRMSQATTPAISAGVNKLILPG
jgi:hypothetical protein